MLRTSSFRRALLVAALFAALPHAVRAAEPGALEGRVTLASGAPAEAVALSLEGTALGALTDARGAFRLTGVLPGSYVLVARRLGLEPFRKAVLVTAGAMLTVEFTMAESVTPLDDIVVTASREKERKVEIPMSIGVVSGETLREVRPTHPSEVMNRVSGVWVNTTGGEGHMTAIRQPITTDPVYLYLEDGIPSRSTGFFNHNALYEINLPQADRIEVSKGPANALYGSDAIGGVVNVSSRAPSLAPQASLIAEGGGHGFGRTLLTLSDTRGANGLRLDGNFTRTDGWRDATGYTREAGSLRWDLRSEGGLRMRTVATFSLIDQQTAGSSVISAADYQDHPETNYTPISLRDVKAWRVSSALEQESGRTLWSLTPYARYDWMRLIPNWSLSFDPQDYTTRNSSLGMLAKVRRDYTTMRTRVLLGADADWSPGDYQEHQLVNLVRQGPVYTSYDTGPVTYDYDVTYLALSPYAQLEMSPITHLRVTAGLRYDRSGYEYDNQLTPLSTGSWRRPEDMNVSYESFCPKAGLTYEFAPELNAFASYRHGFRAPSQSQVFRQGSSVNTVDLHPVKAENLEGGLRGALRKQVTYDVTVYSLEKHDDILTYTRPDGSTEVQNAGSTTHRGIEAGLAFPVARSLRLAASGSHAVHRLGMWQPSATTDLSGLELPNAPRAMGNVTLRFAPEGKAHLRAELEWSHIGSYWMDQANTRRYPGHDVVNLRASVPAGAHLVASVRALNLTDVRYAETSQYTNARGEEYAPGMPRTWYASLQYDFR